MIILRRILIISFFIFPNFSYASLPICAISNDKIADLFFDIKNNIIKIESLNRCQKQNSFLFSLLINNIDPHYLKYSDQSLTANPSFIIKFLPLDYQIMQYISDPLKRNREFVLNAAKINIDILKYVNPIILDDREFAIKLININPKSFLYLSDKLQGDAKLTMMALKLDADIFPNILDDLRSQEKIIDQAVISHPFNYQLLTKEQQESDFIKTLKILPNSDNKLFFKKYLKEQYANSEIGMNIMKGYKITNRASNFFDDMVFFQRYPAYWQKYPIINDQFGYKLVIDRKNVNNWEDKFNKYPDLIIKIKDFLSNKIGNLAIDSMSAISIWEISDQEIIFNLYGLRTIDDEQISDEIINVNSLTAIAILEDNKWQLNIIDAIYDSNIKTDISYQNGHKRFYIWDLYEDSDNNLSIIFKIEDKYSQYFKIYQEDKIGNYKEFYQLGGYYDQIIIDPESFN